MTFLGVNAGQNAFNIIDILGLNSFKSMANLFQLSLCRTSLQNAKLYQFWRGGAKRAFGNQLSFMIFS